MHPCLHLLALQKRKRKFAIWIDLGVCPESNREGKNHVSYWTGRSSLPMHHLGKEDRSRRSDQPILAALFSENIKDDLTSLAG